MSECRSRMGNDPYEKSFIEAKSFFSLGDHLIRRIVYGYERKGSYKELPQTFVTFTRFDDYAKEVQIAYDSKDEIFRHLQSIELELIKGAEVIRKTQFHKYCAMVLKELGFEFKSDEEYYNFFSSRISSKGISDKEFIILDLDSENPKDIMIVRHNLIIENLDGDLKITIG
ncbi:hypothetical protein [Flavobacterium sp. 38-13]|uniref:hypothetical protein n=1 Tax=Flavobacterium sp. 38-13 TaxID=1896168 RepID=UPI002580012E|nr:hypothetical protein [Flavobacterium sp. 38-13]